MIESGLDLAVVIVSAVFVATWLLAFAMVLFNVGDASDA